MKLEVQTAEGLPVARYPEYDYQTGRERPDWATVVEYIPPLEKNKNFGESLVMLNDLEMEYYKDEKKDPKCFKK